MHAWHSTFAGLIVAVFQCRSLEHAGAAATGTAEDFEGAADALPAIQ
jgi:hypothetical protein